MASPQHARGGCRAIWPHPRYRRAVRSINGCADRQPLNIINQRPADGLTCKTTPTKAATIRPLASTKAMIILPAKLRPPGLKVSHVWTSFNIHASGLTAILSGEPPLSTVSIQTQSIALRKRKPQETQALAFFVYATHATQAIAFEWKPGLSLHHHHRLFIPSGLHNFSDSIALHMCADVIITNYYYSSYKMFQ